MTRLVFVRHGQSAANVQRTIANGRDGFPLTDVGRAQAAGLAGQLGYPRPDLVLTSPVLRARQTAQIVAHTLAVPVVERAELAECWCGELEGRSDDDAWAVHGAVNADWAAGRRHSRPPGGESLDDVLRRLQPLVAELGGRPSGTFLLVSHGSLVQSALPVLLGLPVGFGAAHPLDHLDAVQVAFAGGAPVSVDWAAVGSVRVA